MKKIVITFLAFASVATTMAQVLAPQPSPVGKNIQKVGLTTITLEYSRPGVKDRTIFGDLVTYGKVWRTGANANTKITIDTEISVEGQTLTPGTYALYSIPNKESWDIIFYSDSENWGTPKEWDDSKIAAKTTVTPNPIPFFVESLTIDFNKIKSSSAILEIFWEKTYVAIPLEVPTHRIVMKSIEKTMKSKPTINDYYAAANYFLETDGDIKQAKKWIDKVVKEQKDKPKFWVLRRQSLIHAKAGDKKGAIKAAKKSLELAKKANNRNYINMNKASMKEWGIEI